MLPDDLYAFGHPGYNTSTIGVPCWGQRAALRAKEKKELEEDKRLNNLTDEADWEDVSEDDEASVALSSKKKGIEARKDTEELQFTGLRAQPSTEHQIMPKQEQEWQRLEKIVEEVRERLEKLELGDKAKQNDEKMPKASSEEQAWYKKHLPPQTSGQDKKRDKKREKMWYEEPFPPLPRKTNWDDIPNRPWYKQKMAPLTGQQKQDWDEWNKQVQKPDDSRLAGRTETCSQMKATRIMPDGELMIHDEGKEMTGASVAVSKEERNQEIMRLNYPQPVAHGSGIWQRSMAQPESESLPAPGDIKEKAQASEAKTNIKTEKTNTITTTTKVDNPETTTKTEAKTRNANLTSQADAEMVDINLATTKPDEDEEEFELIEAATPADTKAQETKSRTGLLASLTSLTSRASLPSRSSIKSIASLTSLPSPRNTLNTLASRNTLNTLGSIDTRASLNTIASFNPIPSLPSLPSLPIDASLTTLRNLVLPPPAPTQPPRTLLLRPPPSKYESPEVVEIILDILEELVQPNTTLTEDEAVQKLLNAWLAFCKQRLAMGRDPSDPWYGDGWIEELWMVMENVEGQPGVTEREKVRLWKLRRLANFVFKEERMKFE